MTSISPKKQKPHAPNIPLFNISPVTVPEGAKQIGNYILGKTIGNGTYGKVHLGLHIPTGERVAAKIIDKAKCNTKQLMLIQRQIDILKKIMHPALIHLHQVIQTQKSLLIITQYIQNGELFHYILKKQKLPEEEACRIFHQLIDGVQYLHKLGIAHRDLKPQNILIDYDGAIKIIDFGLSNTYQKNTKLKTQCGSPCYVAPEMLAGKHRYDPLPIDIWSAGVVLFVMIAGYLPFCDPNTQKLYKKILSGTFKFPLQISQSAKNLLSKILITNPQKRATLSQITSHPWYNIIKIKKSLGINPKLYKIPLQTVIIHQIQNMGYKLPMFIQNVQNNVLSKQTALYYIIAKKITKQGNYLANYYASKNFDKSKLVPRQQQIMQVESIGMVPVQQQFPLTNSSLQLFVINSLAFQSILRQFLNLSQALDDSSLKALKSTFYGNNIHHKNKQQNINITSNKQPRYKSLFALNNTKKHCTNDANSSPIRNIIFPAIKQLTTINIDKINKSRYQNNNNYHNKCCIQLAPIVTHLVKKSITTNG